MPETIRLYGIVSVDIACLERVQCVFSACLERV